MQQHQQFRVDKTKMKDDITVTAFQKELAQQLNIISSTNTNVDFKYEKFVDIMKTTATKYFKLAENANKKSKEWITDEILVLAKKKGDAYV